MAAETTNQQDPPMPEAKKAKKEESSGVRRSLRIAERGDKPKIPSEDDSEPVRRRRKTTRKKKTPTHKKPRRQTLQQQRMPEYIETQNVRMQRWVEDLKPEKPPQSEQSLFSYYSSSAFDSGSSKSMIMGADPQLRDIKGQQSLLDVYGNHPLVETPRLRVPLAEKTLGPSDNVTFFECTHLNHVTAVGSSTCELCSCVKRTKLTKMPSLDFCAQPLYHVNGKFARMELPEHIDQDLLDLSTDGCENGWRGVLVEMLHSYSTDEEKKRMKDLASKNSRFRTEPTSLRIKVMKIDDLTRVQSGFDHPMTLLMHFYESLKAKVTKCIEFFITKKRTLLLTNVWRTWPDGTSSKVPHTEALMATYILQQFGLPITPMRDVSEHNAFQPLKDHTLLESRRKNPKFVNIYDASLPAEEEKDEAVYDDTDEIKSEHA